MMQQPLRQHRVEAALGEGRQRIDVTGEKPAAPTEPRRSRRDIGLAHIDADVIDAVERRQDIARAAADIEQALPRLQRQVFARDGPQLRRAPDILLHAIDRRDAENRPQAARRLCHGVNDGETGPMIT